MGTADEASPLVATTRGRLGAERLGYTTAMIVIGLVLLLLGFLLSIPILWTLGIIVLIVGLVLLVLGSTNRAVGGRRHYW
jgi:hypothetical protein